MQELVFLSVAKAAKHTPHAVALRAAGKCLSYAEMDEAADRLAVRLGWSGVGAEVLVGICLPRSFDRVIAMLATWKAGGAVLALDPAWPVSRLHALLEDSHASVLVTTEALASELDSSGRTTLVLDRNATVAHEMPPTAPVAAGDPDALAYVVYTSGSTGVPKGVEITHRNLSHLIEWHRSEFALTTADRAAHVAGLGFDASFWEIWPALCAGASIVLAEDEELRTSPALLQRWLLDWQVTVAFVPTVLAEVLITLPWPPASALQRMLTGGEALHVRPSAGLPFTLVNNYGPSECTVVVTSGPVSATGDDGPPDIGRPIARTQVYLLDDQGRQVVDGDIGEIVVGGAGVGRGYRNRPDLTEACFQRDRFQPAAGARLYRTGDLGRRLPDGRIVFLGRNDEQEQIRGIRVEPAEVAAILMRHPSVQWGVVMANGPPRNRRLVAYVLPAPEGRPTAEALREFMAAQLPAAMVPLEFVQIDAIPLSANGKLDRDALPRAAQAISMSQAGPSSPTSPTEARLAAIIGDLLGVPVGADDNFFLLGGHSLLGTQVIMRVREAFGVDISLHSLFEAPTVAELAEHLADLLAERLNEMTDEEVELWVAS